jgi:hypothetical protein
MEARSPLGCEGAVADLNCWSLVRPAADHRAKRRFSGALTATVIPTLAKNASSIQITRIRSQDHCLKVYMYGTGVFGTLGGRERAVFLLLLSDT